MDELTAPLTTSFLKYSLMDDLPYLEELQVPLSHAMPTTGHSGRYKAGNMPERLGIATSLLWSESEKSIWPKYEILADHAIEHGSREMLNIIWPNGPSSPGDVPDYFR